jgi:Domain of unknown function (DUF4177)
MISISCPSCGEKGNLPNQLLGKRIKCQKCGKSFLAGSSSLEAPAKPAVALVGGEAPSDNAIDVAGLDAWAWTAPAAVAATSAATATTTAAPSSGFIQHHNEHEHEPVHEEASAAFNAPVPAAAHADLPRREYKVLTQKDRWFEGKYELSRLEEALNHYAREGWVVRAMATPHVTGFSGGIREELVVLLER